jgi:hypothetical protein
MSEFLSGPLESLQGFLCTVACLQVVCDDMSGYL